MNGHFCCIKIVSTWRILREKHTYNSLVNEKCRQQPHLSWGKLPSSRIFSGALLKSIEYRQIYGIDQNMLPFLFHTFHIISISAKILESTEMMLLKQITEFTICTKLLFFVESQTSSLSLCNHVFRVTRQHLSDSTDINKLQQIVNKKAVQKPTQEVRISLSLSQKSKHKPLQQD